MHFLLVWQTCVLPAGYMLQYYNHGRKKEGEKPKSGLWTPSLLHSRIMRHYQDGTCVHVQRLDAKCCCDSHKRHHGLHKAVKCNTLQYYTIGSLRAIFFSWAYKCIWYDTGNGNPSSCKTRTRLFYTVNIIGTDVQATQGAWASTTMSFNYIYGIWWSYQCREKYFQ